jgi:hypothetical protein
MSNCISQCVAPNTAQFSVFVKKVIQNRGRKILEDRCPQGHCQPHKYSMFRMYIDTVISRY